jgi:hypothetical protein
VSIASPYSRRCSLLPSDTEKIFLACAVGCVFGCGAKNNRRTTRRLPTRSKRRPQSNKRRGSLISQRSRSRITRSRWSRLRWPTFFMSQRAMLNRRSSSTGKPSWGKWKELVINRRLMETAHKHASGAHSADRVSAVIDRRYRVNVSCIRRNRGCG